MVAMEALGLMFWRVMILVMVYILVCVIQGHEAMKGRGSVTLKLSLPEEEAREDYNPFMTMEYEYFNNFSPKPDVDLPPSPTELTPSGGHRRHGDIESQLGFNPKLDYPTPKVSTNAREVSVLMPGNNIPTFIAHPAPVPCQPERNPWPSHQNPLPCVINSNSNASS